MGLLDRLLGRKGEARASTAAPTPPWGDEVLRGNVAIGEVRDMLPGLIQDERGVHFETLMVLAGTMYGVAVASAVRARAAAGERLGLMQLGGADGVTYWAGDPLNAYLVDEDPAILSLWSLAAGAAVEAGADVARLPEAGPVFARVAGSLGGPAFGVVRGPPDHQPFLTVRQALRFWPAVRGVLTRSGTAATRDGALPAAHWPYAVGVAAQQLQLMGRNVLDPAAAMALLYEAAVAASKLDPEALPEGADTPAHVP